MLLLYMSRVQRAVVLELRTIMYFLRFSDPKFIMSQIYWFQYYLTAQLSRNTYHFKVNQRIQRYTQNTLHRRKIEMVNAPLLVQQFTHPVHPNSSYRLSYLLRHFVDKTGKIRNREQAKHKEKTSKTVHTTANILFSRKVTMSIQPAPIKLLVLLGSPSCRPLLLSLFRRTRELLANSGLL